MSPKKAHHNKQLIFIDDSGDPGFIKPTSSRNFVIACIVFNDSNTATIINNAINKLRKSYNWSDNVELKFQKTNKEKIISILKELSKYDFEIYAVYSNKTTKPKNHYKNGGEIYNFAIAELLRIIPLHNSYIKIDGKYNKRYKLNLVSYIRHTTHKNHYDLAEIKPQDSKKDNLIQLADLVAGAINRSMQPNKTDSQVYISIIKKKIKSLQQLSL